MNNQGDELIAVRSLTESDLGIFAAHRAYARSKQRAININSAIAKELFSSTFMEKGGGPVECTCVFGNIAVKSPRHIGKIHKNWRLGGAKIEGEAFASLDSKDFVLIRSVAGNDGKSPLFITFVCRQTDRVVHAGLAAIVQKELDNSMALYRQGQVGFSDLARYCTPSNTKARAQDAPAAKPKVAVLPMPDDPINTGSRKKARTVQEKLRTPHLLERMLSVAGDLSAPAQLRFMKTVEELASQLRQVLLATGGIVTIERNHAALWKSVANKPIGFVDGGLANLSMLGSAPIAARVGGYVAIPGVKGEERERFTVLKYLIDELYAHEDGGVYDDTFPDIGALRDAARISIESAGAVRMASEQTDIAWIMVHGALVNPVSRYTDVMRDGQVRHRFPDFSDTAISEFLPASEPSRSGRDRNFVSVHLRQLQILAESKAVVCGVIEREATTSSVCRAVLQNLDEEKIRPLLPVSPTEWKHWFRSAIDPSEDEENEGQRITDSLLFRCVLEPGEALAPVMVDRNEMRRAPRAWHDVIVDYPKPRVSYLQSTEWSAPIRIEVFEKDVQRFPETASLIMHCALLLPRYAFPVGLDIVDKFAHIPNWMSRPVNTRTAVQALKRALDDGDGKLFDNLRRMLCGSSREWMLRPGFNR